MFKTVFFVLLLIIFLYFIKYILLNKIKKYNSILFISDSKIFQTTSKINKITEMLIKLKNKILVEIFSKYLGNKRNTNKINIKINNLLEENKEKKSKVLTSKVKYNKFSEKLFLLKIKFKLTKIERRIKIKRKNYKLFEIKEIDENKI